MQLFNSRRVRLTLTVLIAMGGSARASSTTAPLAVELNGVCSLFGDRRAVLTTAAQSLILAEGESAGGIKVIAVDMAANCVRIENGGQAQSLRLGGSPNGGQYSGTSGNADHFLARGRDGMVGTPGADGLVAEITPGNPGWGTLAPVAGGNSSKPPAAPSPGSASNPTDPVAALKSQADTEWYQESMSIEQSRQETAAQVLAGQQEPWPRTPLTPAGTPPALVGNGLYFSNHVPRYVVTGSLNQ